MSLDYVVIGPKSGKSLHSTHCSFACFRGACFLSRIWHSDFEMLLTDFESYTGTAALMRVIFHACKMHI